MKKFAALLTTILLGFALIASAPLPVSAQANQNVNVVGYTLTTDPCQNPTVAKSSVAIAITSATTTQLIAVSTGKKISVCGMVASLTGTTPTVLFEYGTSTNCTGTHALTGAIQPTSGSMINLTGGYVQFGTPASQGLCAVTGGTVTFFEGYMVYVQQ